MDYAKLIQETFGCLVSTPHEPGTLDENSPPALLAAHDASQAILTDLDDSIQAIFETDQGVVVAGEEQAVLVTEEGFPELRTYDETFPDEEEEENDELEGYDEEDDEDDEDLDEAKMVKTSKKVFRATVKGLTPWSTRGRGGTQIYKRGKKTVAKIRYKGKGVPGSPASITYWVDPSAVGEDLGEAKKQTFKDLASGDQFEFDRSGLPVASGMARGPWIKTGPRTYKHVSNPKLDKVKVGSIGVKVVKEDLDEAENAFYDAMAGSDMGEFARAWKKELTKAGVWKALEKYAKDKESYNDVGRVWPKLSGKVKKVLHQLAVKHKFGEDLDEGFDAVPIDDAKALACPGCAYVGVMIRLGDDLRCPMCGHTDMPDSFVAQITDDLDEAKSSVWVIHRGLGKGQMKVRFRADDLKKVATVLKKAGYKPTGAVTPGMATDTGRYLEFEAPGTRKEITAILKALKDGGLAVTEGELDEKLWSADVKMKWSPPGGFFKQESGKIAKGLKEASNSLKQAISRLNFYINRAGGNLTAEDLARVKASGPKLRKMYGPVENALVRDTFLDENMVEMELDDADSELSSTKVKEDQDDPTLDEIEELGEEHPTVRRFRQATEKQTARFKKLIDKPLRVKSGDVPMQLVGVNDLGVPYFAKVIKGKVQKKRYTIGLYNAKWLEKQLVKRESADDIDPPTLDEIEDYLVGVVTEHSDVDFKTLVRHFDNAKADGDEAGCVEAAQAILEIAGCGDLREAFGEAEEAEIDEGKRYYVGVKGMKRKVFLSAEKPTAQSHGKQYAAVIGPFRTKAGAEIMAKYGHNNPHLQDVAAAERRAKRDKQKKESADSSVTCTYDEDGRPVVSFADADMPVVVPFLEQCGSKDWPVDHRGGAFRVTLPDQDKLDEFGTILMRNMGVPVAMTGEPMDAMFSDEEDLEEGGKGYYPVGSEDKTAVKKAAEAFKALGAKKEFKGMKLTVSPTKKIGDEFTARLTYEGTPKQVGKLDDEFDKIVARFKLSEDAAEDAINRKFAELNKPLRGGHPARILSGEEDDEDLDESKTVTYQCPQCGTVFDDEGEGIHNCPMCDSPRVHVYAEGLDEDAYASAISRHLHGTKRETTGALMTKLLKKQFGKEYDSRAAAKAWKALKLREYLVPVGKGRYKWGMKPMAGVTVTRRRKTNEVYAEGLDEYGTDAPDTAKPIPTEPVKEAGEKRTEVNVRVSRRSKEGQDDSTPIPVAAMKAVANRYKAKLRSADVGDYETSRRYMVPGGAEMAAAFGNAVRKAYDLKVYRTSYSFHTYEGTDEGIWELVDEGTVDEGERPWDRAEFKRASKIAQTEAKKSGKAQVVIYVGEGKDFKAKTVSQEDTIPKGWQRGALAYPNGRIKNLSQEDIGEARGQGQGVGGSRQGDAGTDTCVCPKCGAKAPHERGTPCNQMECPKCGAAMIGEDLLGEGLDVRGQRDGRGPHKDSFQRTRSKQGRRKAAGEICPYEDEVGEELKLSAKDKAVIRAFTDKKKASSKKLTTNGTSLDGLWQGGSGLAVWQAGKINLVDKGGKSSDVIHQAIRKEAPKNDINEDVDEAKKTSIAQKYLGRKINFGGETVTVAQAIKTMQDEGTPQKRIDAYIMGALQGKKIRGEDIDAWEPGDEVETSIARNAFDENTDLEISTTEVGEEEGLGKKKVREAIQEAVEKELLFEDLSTEQLREDATQALDLRLRSYGLLADVGLVNEDGTFTVEVFDSGSGVLQEEIGVQVEATEVTFDEVTEDEDESLTEVVEDAYLEFPREELPGFIQLAEATGAPRDLDFQLGETVRVDVSQLDESILSDMIQTFNGEGVNWLLPEHLREKLQADKRKKAQAALEVQAEEHERG